MTLDNDLKRRVIACDRRAQLQLYELIYNDLISVAQRYKNNDEDIQTLINNAYMKIIANLHKYNETNNFKGWIKRTIMNEVIENFRKEKNYKEFFNHDYEVEKVQIQEIAKIEYKYSNDELLAMMNKLPKASRMVFNMFVIDGYSHKEICEQLGISGETSKWHMKESKKKLQEMLLKR